MRVLVWITCRNYEKFIEHSKASVRRQTHSCYIAMRHDDCGGKLPQGVAALRNEVVDYHEYMGVVDYVLFLDADDYLPSNYVEELLKTADGNACVVACAARLFGDEDRVVKVREPVNLDTLLKGNTVHVSALIPYQSFCEVGGFDPTLESHEDWDLWCRLAARGVEFRVNHSTYLWYRRHAGSRSCLNRSGYARVKERLNKEFAKEKV